MLNTFGAALYSFVDKYMYWLNVPKLGVTDIIEMIIIGVVMYYVLVWVKNTRAWALFKGILVIFVFLLIAAILQMDTILWLSGKLASVALVALVIIFQPELRTALERLGRTSLVSAIFNFDFQKSGQMRFSEKTISEMVRACFEMGKVKTGALIVMERNVQLKEYARTGIALDSVISSQLLINIFEHNTPLHDGAVIVREDRIVSATCYLPLSDNRQLSKDLGTRHRAAVGISEVSDSITIVVSEETGAVSMAMEGVLYHNLDADTLKTKLKEGALVTAGGSNLIKGKRRLKAHAGEDRQADNK